MKLRAAVVALIAMMSSGCTTLSAFNTLVPKDPSVRLAQGVAYGEDPRQKLDVYAPKRGAANLPVVVFFYGGGWYEGRRQDYAFAARAFASRGYLTVVPDYRVYPQVVYPAFLQDGAQAVRWVEENAATWGGDPTRIVLAGHSAGAYNAVELGMDPSFLKAAGVDVSHIRGLVGLSGPYDFLPFDVDASKNAFGSYPDPAATQTINHVRADAPPVFLAQGTADTVVGVHNAVNLDKALKAVGAPVETHIYEGRKHADTALMLARPFRFMEPLMAQITDFLTRVTENP